MNLFFRVAGHKKINFLLLNKNKKKSIIFKSWKIYKLLIVLYDIVNYLDNKNFLKGCSRPSIFTVLKNLKRPVKKIF